jgi:hypothetical protein
LRKIVLITTVVIVPIFSWGAQLFVAPNGNDSNLGTISSPLRTINQAVGRARGGDYVLVRGGTYFQQVSIWNSGSATNGHIHIKPYNGETAIIDGSQSPNNSDLITIGGNYIEIEGFHIRNAKRTAIAGWNTSHSRILNNTISNSFRGAIWIGFDRAGSSVHNLIEGNTAYNNCLVNISRTASGGWPVAIMTSASDHSTIRNNRVYKNYGEGLGSLSSVGTQITHNIVYDNFSVGIYLDNTRDVLVDSNYVYSTGDTNFYRSGHPAMGISLAIEHTSIYYPLVRNKIINNVVVNARQGFQYGNYERGGGLQENLIANNTFVNSSQYAINIDSDSHRQNLVTNNIFSGSLSGSLANGHQSGFDFSYNCWHGSRVFSGAGDVLADPQFVDTEKSSADGFKLFNRSPCASSGSAVSSVQYDYDGLIRTSPYSMGAFHINQEPPLDQPPIDEPPVDEPPVDDFPINPPPIDESPSSDNLLQNPGFEAGSQHWSNWGNASIVIGGSSEGHQVLRVGTGSGGMGQDILAKTQSGQKYHISAIAKVDNLAESAWIAVEYWDANNRLLAKESVQITSRDYAQYDLEIIAPANATRAFVFIWKDAGSAYAYVDNFSLSLVNASDDSGVTPPYIDTEPPNIHITAPVNGNQVRRKQNLTIQATATDNIAVSRVEFFVNGHRTCTVQQAPYNCTWRVPNSRRGSYRIEARAFDAAGNVSSDQVNVTSD